MRLDTNLRVYVFIVISFGKSNSYFPKKKIVVILFIVHILKQHFKQENFAESAIGGKFGTC